MRNAIGNAKLMKTVNTSIILSIIRKIKRISRAEIAKTSKLNPSTVSNLTSELIEMGLLKEVGVGISQKGRKPMQLSLNPDSPCVIGVEVVEDRTIALMVNLEAKIMAEVRTNIDVAEIGKSVIKKMIGTIREVIKKSGKAKSEIKAIGIGITGLIEFEPGIAKFSPNIGWKDIPVKKIVEEEFGIQTFVDNDGKAMALGEYRFGLGNGTQDLVCINMGEGLGSGIIIDGRIYRGANWIAGEIGHIVVDLNGPRCRCGNRGCLETFTSGRAMVSNAIVAIKQGRETLISQLVNNELDKITPKIIFQAANRKDKLARDIIEETGEYLGIAIANVTNSFDPEVIIIGGEIAQFDNFNLMLEPAKKASVKHTFGGRRRKTKILVTELGDNSPAIGAATLAIEKLFNPLSL